MNDAGVPRAARMYRSGLSTGQIGRELGINPGLVWKKLVAAGVSMRSLSLAVGMAQGRRATVDSQGYPRWGDTRVHRIVCKAWHGPPPTPDHEVNHIDGDKTNAHPENLEWVTHSENMRHAIAKGLHPGPPLHFGEGQHAAKLTESDVREMRRLWASGWSAARLGRRYGVAETTAHRAATGRSWKHVEEYGADKKVGAPEANRDTPRPTGVDDSKVADSPPAGNSGRNRRYHLCVSYPSGHQTQTGFDGFDEALAAARAEADKPGLSAVRVFGDGYEVDSRGDGFFVSHDGLSDDEVERLEEVLHG